MKLSVYQDGGCRLLNELAAGGCLKYKVAAGINIAKGDALHGNAAGYVTNATTDFAATFIGIAAEPANNTSGAAGALEVLIIPPLPQYKYSIPVDGNAVISQAVVGEFANLGADAKHLAINVIPTEGWAFIIDDFDASAEAVAAHTYGYAIVRIVVVGTQA